MASEMPRCRIRGNFINLSPYTLWVPFSETPPILAAVAPISSPLLRFAVLAASEARPAPFQRTSPAPDGVCR
jgi:hypothetical protein